MNSTQGSTAKRREPGDYLMRPPRREVHFSSCSRLLTFISPIKSPRSSRANHDLSQTVTEIRRK